MSAVVPTAWKRPPLTAKASAVGMAGSMVVTLALITTRSALASSDAALAAQDEPIRAAPPKPMVSRKRLRFCLIFMLPPSCDDAAPPKAAEDHARLACRTFRDNGWSRRNRIQAARFSK